MSRFVKVVMISLLILLAAGTLFAQDAGPKAAFPAYALSILLGFGTGHYYVGANGTPFLIGDLVGVGGMAAGGIIAVASLFSAATNPTYTGAANAISGAAIGYGVLGVGAAVYLVSRVWEDISIFGAVDAAKKAGKVAEVVPVVNIQPTSFELGLSVKY